MKPQFTKPGDLIKASRDPKMKGPVMKHLAKKGAIKKTGSFKGKSNKLGGGGRFAQLAAKAGGGKKGAAIAAAAGRKKYGKKKMSSMAAKGKKVAMAI